MVLKDKLSGSGRKSGATRKRKATKKPSSRKKAPRRKKAGGGSDFVMELIGAASAVKGADVYLAEDAETLADVVEWIPTGFAGLDEIFGGGWHVGRVSEVFGAEASGKSALAHVAVRECLRQGGAVVYFDFEHALEKKTLIQLGINPKKLVYVEPDHMEQGFDILFALLNRLISKPPKHPTLIVWDSVGGSPAKAEFEEKSAEDSHVAAKARVLSKSCGKLFKRVARARAHVMLINQERTKIGGYGMNPELQTVGGKATKYTFSLRVRCMRVSTVRRDGTSGPALGYLIRVVTRKNKCAPPHQEATWYLDFKHGPSPDLTMYHVLKDANRIRWDGSSRAYVGPWSCGVTFGKGDKWLAALARSEMECQLPNGIPGTLREAAEAAYLEVVKAGGAKALLALETGVGEEE